MIHSKRLSEIKNDFERGVFLVVYQSPKQKRYRAVAITALAVKHAFRGVLFSWPLYLLTLAAFAVPGSSKLIFVLLLIPGIYVSWVILSRGVKEDYDNLVDGYILKSGYLGKILFHRNIG
ncbi:MAG: hypothetical protein WBO93_01090 [Gammaproteobacteria bacterium]